MKVISNTFSIDGDRQLDGHAIVQLESSDVALLVNDRGQYPEGEPSGASEELIQVIEDECDCTIESIVFKVEAIPQPGDFKITIDEFELDED